MLPLYSTGTASVAAGGILVTGVGTIWTGGNVSAGDEFYIGSIRALVVDVVSATQLTITPWPGAAQAGVAYKVYQNSPRRFDDVQIADDLRKQVQALNLINYFIPVQDSQAVPDPSLGDENQRAFQDLTGKWWKKEGGVWNLKGNPYGLQPAQNLADLVSVATARQNLGLIKQTSANDVTADRVLMTGAYGWGTNSLAAADLNAAINPGVYASDPATASRPPGNTYYNVIVVRLGSALISQIAALGTSSSTNTCYMRGSNDNGTTWSAWSRFYMTSNIVGTVSQSGGVPTGAIVERGNNGNGSWVRFADGTQICWFAGQLYFAIEASYGSIYQGGAGVSYPVSFTNIPSVSANGCRTGQIGMAMAVGASTSGFFFRVIDWFSRGADFNDASYVAIGRWF
ncbi:MAG: pyocin knob domain-containing protein [Xanthobacteraceae bacterium]